MKNFRVAWALIGGGSMASGLSFQRRSHMEIARNNMITADIISLREKATLSSQTAVNVKLKFSTAVKSSILTELHIRCTSMAAELLPTNSQNSFKTEKCADS
jgi:hypothetical protein